MQISELAKPLKPSRIRQSTARCQAIGGINLGQGLCPLPPPECLHDAMLKAIKDGHNAYSPANGIAKLREAISHKAKTFNHIDADPETEVLVTHGSAGAMSCLIKALFNPGDEVITFAPLYGYYIHQMAIQQVDLKTVPMDFLSFALDYEALENSITDKTKAILICSPANPNGKVFTREELSKVGTIAKKHNLTIITDEIYEYFTYPEHEHISMASMPEFKDRTVTLSGFSKTFNMTGWRVGYAIAPAPLIEKMALLQDLYLVSPHTPSQYAVLSLFDLPDSYFDQMRAEYLEKRDLVVNGLEALGFDVAIPQGAYYAMFSADGHDLKDYEDIASLILETAKVALVSGSDFYQDPKDGIYQARLCFAHYKEDVEKALVQMQKHL